MPHKASTPSTSDEAEHPRDARRITRRVGSPRTDTQSRDAHASARGFAHSEPRHDLHDGGGAVFEVPFEAFFDAPAEGSPEAPNETGRGAQHEEAEPQTDRFERTSTSRASRNSRNSRTNEAPGRQRPERSLKGRALGYLSRREYSRAELSRKLMPFTENADELEALLDALEREGWLSDARFAESVVYRRAARVGAGRIVSELKRHAVGDELIEEVNAQLRETELARARAVWQKKYGQLPETPAERARQARFLAARGFSMSIIGKILKGIEDSFEGE
ncbi:Regulatory protein RecX [Paraburkholderia caffeinitolerans]|uniref:Regulatory protein RecX n=1 Tax=Paraburkholderia caffeinitolerans TaxID=1723730 RepID=A0A6J5GDN1_9BURK|nr:MULTISPECIES: recombination regulator RecX [Paraburkholderia]CAB3796995.1 Regulatory protein RecX [Paraburkholderia caffeinitolerans]